MKKTIFNNSINLSKYRITFIILVVFILTFGFLAISLGSYWVSRNVVRNHITSQELILTGDNIYSKIQDDLLKPVLIASMMAHDTLLRDWLLSGENNERKISRYLSEIKEKYSTVTSFLISPKTMRYYQPNPGNIKDYHLKKINNNDDWYFKTMKFPDLYEVNVDVDRRNGNRLTIFINHKVYDYSNKNKIIGITGVGLTFSAVAQMIKGYQKEFNRQVYFVNHTGIVVLADSSTNLIGKSIYEVSGIQNIAAAIMAEKHNHVKLEYSKASDVTLVNSRYIKELDWYLIVEQSESVNLAPIRQALFQNILIGSSVVVVITACMLLLIRHYRNQIEGMALANIDLAKQRQTFLAQFSHEIRNIITSFDASIENLLRAGSDQPSYFNKKYKGLQSISNYIRSLVDNFLLDSRLQSQDFHLNLSLTDINIVIKEITSNIFSTTSHRLIFNRTTESIIVNCDTSLISIALINLIQNAAKYSPEADEIQITSSLKGEILEVSITDFGIGIPLSEQEKIFRPYYRIEKNNIIRGTGLGLSLVRRIIDLHAGYIRLKSSEGKGTTIKIGIPLNFEGSAMTISNS